MNGRYLVLALLVLCVSVLGGAWLGRLAAGWGRSTSPRFVWAVTWMVPGIRLVGLLSAVLLIAAGVRAAKRST